MATSPNAADKAVTATQDFVFADTAMFEVLLELARNYKGIEPAIDERIDAMAAFIANDKRVTFISPHQKGAPRVPLYLEGEPGQGKSSLVESACKKFCEICGLNYIKEPEESYVFQPLDFYYVKVNLSGAQNKSDFGGMMVRTEAEAQQFIKSRRKTSDVGSVVLDEMVSRAKALSLFGLDMSADLKFDIKQYEQGGLDCVEFHVSGDAKLSESIASSVLTQISNESKERGVGMSLLSNGAEALEGRISYSFNKKPGASILAVYAPKPLESRAEYASAVLPSIRFAKFKKARFGLVNFDDVANANENIRNILLEVLQEGRYTGTMDIGNAYVTLSGNQGAEDGTNVMSRMSDAELTRMRKLNVRDRPEDWANRVIDKYGSSEVGDCYFASFIARHGNQSGIFREPEGVRGKRGERKTNGRALENAMTVVMQHFMAAKAANISVGEFRPRIMRDIKDCAGSRVADAYDGYLHSMVTEAIPLADDLINSGKWNRALFHEISALGRTSSGQDFCYRFATALSDSIINRVAHGQAKEDPDTKKVMKELSLSMERACTGLAELMSIGKADVMNYSLSNLSRRIMNIPRFSTEDNAGRKISAETCMALSEGFSRACNADVWGDEKTQNSAVNNFAKTVSGTNFVPEKPSQKMRP